MDIFWTPVRFRPGPPFFRKEVMTKELTAGVIRRKDYKETIERLEKKGWTPNKHIIAMSVEPDSSNDRMWGREKQPLWKKIYYKFYRAYSAVKDTIFNTYWWKRIWYRIRHGFDPADTWSLDNVLARWMVPRLKYLQENKHGYPTRMYKDNIGQNATDEESEQAVARWDYILGEIIWTFEFYIDDDAEYCSDEEWERWKAGMLLFTEYYQSLWD